MEARAFAPGHISGFFEPVYMGQNLEKSGSRGAGINISLGATSQVSAKNAVKQNIEIYINNKKSPAPVTQMALRYLLGDAPLAVRVNTQLDLPIGQGFGMSAAGALSTTYALASILNIPKEQAIKASHVAEVQLCTGLGDVLASSVGGLEIRREAGLPPWGMIEHIPGMYELVLCVIGKKLMTKNILTNTQLVNEIAQYGRYCTKKILEKPSVENLFFLSQMFTKKIGFADIRVLEAIDAVKNYGMASMCMLGNSVFSTGKIDNLQAILSTFGRVYRCYVDQWGARVLEEK